ncbi:molybdopterin-guanine dinucleotide biosynthesis protein B [Paenibacillus tarimensis]
MILQIVGFKNTGKTTLICKLIERMKSDGMKVGVIKHDAHDFQMDYPGTDTWKHQSAGADSVAITSPHRTAWLSAAPMPLEQLIRRMDAMDVVLVEGFKHEPYPKLIMIKEPADLELLEALHHPIAAVLWPGLEDNVKWTGIPGQVRRFGINELEELYGFIGSALPFIRGN